MLDWPDEETGSVGDVCFQWAERSNLFNFGNSFADHTFFQNLPCHLTSRETGSLVAVSLPLPILQAESGQIMQMTLFGEMVSAQVGRFVKGRRR